MALCYFARCNTPSVDKQRAVSTQDELTGQRDRQYWGCIAVLTWMLHVHIANQARARAGSIDTFTADLLVVCQDQPMPVRARSRMVSLLSIILLWNVPASTAQLRQGQPF
jgi:hypothetical protein